MGSEAILVSMIRAGFRRPGAKDMELFICRLMTCGSGDEALVEIAGALLRIRREFRFSEEQLDAFIGNAAVTIAVNWTESPHKIAILGCLRKLLGGGQIAHV